MPTISNTPRPGYAYDATDNVWYPIGTGPHTHSDYITQSTAINPAIVDAKGDIIAASAADTVARLAVGTNGQVLTAASGEATGLQWATPVSGSMTQLATGTLASTGNTTITGFSTSYKDLILEIYDYVNATNDMGIRFNSDSGASQYGYSTFGNNTSVSNTGADSNIAAQGFASVGNVGVTRVIIYDYNMNTRVKPVNYSISGTDPFRHRFGAATYKGTAAITTITMFPLTGTSAGTYALFGVN